MRRVTRESLRLITKLGPLLIVLPPALHISGFFAESEAAQMQPEANAKPRAGCQSSADLTVLGVHTAPNPISVPADPDWLSLLEDRARKALKSGEWAERLREHDARLRAWADAPVPPIRRGMTRTTIDVTKPTGLTADQLNSAGFPAGTWSGFARLYLFVDCENETQLRFAERFAAALPEGTTFRPVAAAGRPAELARRLSVRAYADQGGILMRRLGLPALPAVVRLTPEAVRIVVPALDVEGVPEEPIPLSLFVVASPTQTEVRR